MGSYKRAQQLICLLIILLEEGHALLSDLILFSLLVTLTFTCALFLPLSRCPPVLFLIPCLLIDLCLSISISISHFPWLNLPFAYPPISPPRTERCCPQPSRCCRIVGPKSSCCACRLLKWLRPERESARPPKQTVSTDNQRLSFSSTVESPYKAGDYKRGRIDWTKLAQGDILISWNPIANISYTTFSTEMYVQTLKMHWRSI